jgi:hypothetical protein
MKPRSPRLPSSLPPTPPLSWLLDHKAGVEKAIAEVQTYNPSFDSDGLIMQSFRMEQLLIECALWILNEDMRREELDAMKEDRKRRK